MPVQLKVIENSMVKTVADYTWKRGDFLLYDGDVYVVYDLEVPHAVGAVDLNDGLVDYFVDTDRVKKIQNVKVEVTV